MFLLTRFNVRKTSVKGSYFRRVSGLYPATYAKIKVGIGIFQGFYLEFKEFSVVYNISKRFSNSTFRKF